MMMFKQQDLNIKGAAVNRMAAAPEWKNNSAKS
jgi:hypothetical protein